MIRHEDACAVCKRLMTEFGAKVDEEVEEIIWNEMEQKVWINGSKGDSKEILSKLYDIITDIHPKKIAEAIKDDGLRDWCKETQVSLQMLLIQLPIEQEDEK